MKSTATLVVTTPTDREIRMTRDFDAPRELVFDALTRPVRFDESWYPGEAVGTMVLTEREGRTTLTHTLRYESREARDAVLRSPASMAESYDRLAGVVASLVEG